MCVSQLLCSGESASDVWQMKSITIYKANRCINEDQSQFSMQIYCNNGTIVLECHMLFQSQLKVIKRFSNFNLPLFLKKIKKIKHLNDAEVIYKTMFEWNPYVKQCMPN